MNRVVAISLAVVFAAAGIIGFSSLFTVNETEQAIVIQFGAPVDVIEEPGLHFKTPFVQNVIYIDKRILDLDIEPEEVIALDQKRLVVDAFARFRIEKPLMFYQAAGSEIVARSRLKTILVAAMRRVLDALLDDVDRQLALAGELPRALTSRRLAMESAVIVRLARQLASRLRAGDPLATRVSLSKGDFLMATIGGAIEGFVSAGRGARL